jgi:hypothetical protein
MQVEVLRKGSQGIQGTIENIAHHAQPLAHLVQKIVNLIEAYKDDLSFSKWRQGHNVHVFETFDGRKFVFRPLHLKGEGYVGLTLGLRVSRGHEIHLMTIYADASNHITPGQLMLNLRWLSEVAPNNILVKESDL